MLDEYVLSYLYEFLNRREQYHAIQALNGHGKMVPRYLPYHIYNEVKKTGYPPMFLHRFKATYAWMPCHRTPRLGNTTVFFCLVDHQDFLVPNELILYILYTPNIIVEDMIIDLALESIGIDIEKNIETDVLFIQLTSKVVTKIILKLNFCRFFDANAEVDRFLLSTYRQHVEYDYFYDDIFT